MDYELKMPDLSAASDQVKINEWYIGEGETVRRGEALLSVETDKAAMDVESVVSGRVKRILSKDEQTVVAGQVIAIIEVEQVPQQRGPDPSAPKSTGRPDPKSSTPPPPPAAKQSPSAPRTGMFQRNRQRRGET